MPHNLDLIHLDFHNLETLVHQLSNNYTSSQPQNLDLIHLDFHNLETLVHQLSNNQQPPVSRSRGRPDALLLDHQLHPDVSPGRALHHLRLPCGDHLPVRPRPPGQQDHPPQDTVRSLSVPWRRVCLQTSFHLS